MHKTSKIFNRSTTLLFLGTAFSLFLNSTAYAATAATITIPIELKPQKPIETADTNHNNNNTNDMESRNSDSMADQSPKLDKSKERKAKASADNATKKAKEKAAKTASKTPTKSEKAATSNKEDQDNDQNDADIDSLTASGADDDDTAINQNNPNGVTNTNTNANANMTNNPNAAKNANNAKNNAIGNNNASNSNTNNSNAANTANSANTANADTAANTLNKGIDTALIENLTGLKGEYDEKQQIFQLSVPRYDLAVTIDGVRMSPQMGLTSWFAFKNTGKKIVMMGDLVLAEDQVNPVLATILENGLKVTALRNRYLWDTPKVMYMRIEGSGDEKTLALALAKIFVKVREHHNPANARRSAYSTDYSRYGSSKQSRYRSRINPDKTFLSTNKIDEIVGLKGNFDDKIYKIAIGRMLETAGIPWINPDTDPTIKYRSGSKLAKSSKLNILIAFSGSDGEALMNGDFLVPENKLQEVLKVLSDQDIKILSIYPQMPGIRNNPTKMVSIHYWSTGPIEDLAASIREAINVIVQ